MATWSQLFDIQTAVESATQTLLTGSGYTIYTSRGDAVMTAPRYEVVFRLGQPTGRLDYGTDGVVVNSAYGGQLTITIVTPRKTDAGRHELMKEYVLSTLRNSNIYNSGSVMSYHEVHDSVLNGVSPTVDENGEDISAIQYNLKVNMKKSSLP